MLAGYELSADPTPILHILLFESYLRDRAFQGLIMSGNQGEYLRVCCEIFDTMSS